MSLRNMMDSQKERMRQKICAAISEIWHKETGSTLPLTIEGTICITPFPGRTTAFQVTSQVPGKFPILDENCEDAHEVTTKRRKVNEFGEWCSNEGCLGESEDHQIVSNVSKEPSVRDSNNNHSEMMDAETWLVDSGRLPPSDGSDETSDREIESSDAELSAESAEYSTEAGGGEKDKQNDDEFNNDSGVYDLSAVGGTDSECCHSEKKSINLLKNNDSQESSKSVGKESDDNRSTPPPLVVDLSSRESSQPVLSLTYSSTNVQTVIHNMISSKLVATPFCKIADVKGCADVLHITPATTGYNCTAPRLILQKTVKADECVKVATPQTSSFTKPSTPISLIYPISGTQFVQRPLQSLLSIANGASGGSVCVEPSGKFEVPLNVSLQVTNSTTISSPSVKTEPGVDQSTNSNEQKTYRCEYCQKTFLFKSKYQEHLPVHTTERPFECHMCQRTYKYKYDLNVHQRTHQGIPTKSTICPKCNHKFPTNKLLRVHINDAHKDDENIPKIESMQEQDSNLKDSVPVDQETSVVTQCP